MMKKHFKKLVNLALTAVMVMGMSTTTFAKESNNISNDTVTKTNNIIYSPEFPDAYIVTETSPAPNNYSLNNESKQLDTITATVFVEETLATDKNEDIYGLESYDSKINSLHDEISRIEEEKNAALEEFENTTKKDIVNEINERYEEKLSSMETELQKKKAEYDDLDDLVKKQRIYISSNYEAYLGKDFMSMDKLSELNQIMKSDSADTIAQALAVYNNRH